MDCLLNWWVWGLTAACLCGMLSLYFYNSGRTRFALLSLFISALLIRLVAIDLDPFLHPWDERFHALVAKNMIDHPFLPTLVEDPVFSYDYQNWPTAHVWLHKQPLFMWQMAASMWIFGESVFAARLPSAIMGAIMVFFVYRIGKVLKNSETGFIASLFWACSFYSLALAMGVQTNDHGDMAFAFYVTASFWVFAEYLLKPRWKWIFMIGVFAGCAVMIKWLTGMLVFGGWGLAILLDRDWRRSIYSYLHIAAAAITSVIIFLPWQIYIFSRFPQIAAYEAAYNQRHIYEVIEGHAGSWLYYIGNLDRYLAEGTWILLLVGLLVIGFTSVHKKLIGALLINIGVTFAFFSAIMTKLPSYVFVVVPLLFVIMGLVLWYLIYKITKLLSLEHWQKTFLLLIGLFLSLHILKAEDIYNYYMYNQSPQRFNFTDREKFSHNQSIYSKLDSVTEKGTYIIGAAYSYKINAMFHSERRVGGKLNAKQIQQLKAKDIPIAAFSNVADSLKQDPAIKVLPYKLEY